MDILCPEIGQIVSCHICGNQTLPPYKLCEYAHTVCPPCVKYLPRCVCGHGFNEKPHSVIDGVVSAMKLKCKYAKPSDCCGERGDGEGSGCSFSQWYTIQDLREHYRNVCPNNKFTCPITGCGHVTRMDIVTEHYEQVHGPFVELTSKNPRNRYQVYFMMELPPLQPFEMVQKIFNGYFFLTISSRPRHRYQERSLQMTMKNINPTDSLQYNYNMHLKSNMITVTVSIMRSYYNTIDFDDCETVNNVV